MSKPNKKNTDEVKNKEMNKEMNKESFASIYDEFNLQGKKIQTLCITAVYDDGSLKNGMIVVGRNGELTEIDKKLASVFSSLPSIIDDMDSVEDETFVKIPGEDEEDTEEYVKKVQKVFNVADNLDIHANLKEDIGTIELSLINILKLSTTSINMIVEDTDKIEETVRQLSSQIELKTKDAIGISMYYGCRLVRELRTKYPEEVETVLTGIANIENQSSNAVYETMNNLFEETSILEDLYIHFIGNLNYDECKIVLIILLLDWLSGSKSEIKANAINYINDLRKRKVPLQSSKKKKISTINKKLVTILELCDSNIVTF